MSFVTSVTCEHQFHTYSSVLSLLVLSVCACCLLPGAGWLCPLLNSHDMVRAFTVLAHVSVSGSPRFCWLLVSRGWSDQSLHPGESFFCVWKYYFTMLSPSWPSQGPRRHSKHFCLLLIVQVVWSDIRRLPTQGHVSHLQALICYTHTAVTVSGSSLHSWSGFF